MSYIITAGIALLVGFVAGLLVYRKHGADAEAEAKAEVEELKAKLEALKKAAKG